MVVMEFQLPLQKKKKVSPYSTFPSMGDLSNIPYTSDFKSELLLHCLAVQTFLYGWKVAGESSSLCLYDIFVILVLNVLTATGDRKNLTLP